VKLAKFACQYELEAYRIIVGRKWIPERQTELASRNREDYNMFHIILLKLVLKFVVGSP
jgi:hypothetical protein